MAKQPLPLLYLSILFLTLARLSHSRPIIGSTNSSSSSLSLVSDGGNILKAPSTYIHLNTLLSSDSSCDETYGFLPCTTTVLGNIFLILVYSYFMFLAAKQLSNGSEILLEILGPGIIGGLFLPVLSSLPDATIILASGLSGSTETAQSQVSVGMGLLAGSTVMLLTVLWGACLLVGKCDIEGSAAVDSKDTKRFSLTGSGVSTDIWTSYAARIMIVSVIPFIIPEIFNTRLAILISLFVSVSLLICYSLYQIFQPWIQRRRLVFSKYKQVVSGILQNLKSRGLGRFFTDAGEPNEVVIEMLFDAIDENSDGQLSATELRALVVGIQFEGTDMDMDDAIKELMKQFDCSKDCLLDKEEFVRIISKWLKEAKHSARKATGRVPTPRTPSILNDFREQTMREQTLLGNNNDEAEESVGNPKWNALKAVSMLLLGTVVAAVFADPLVDAVNNFSTASSIPSFFVSFVILPFASSSELVSCIIFARRKKSKTASLTYSEIYGSVTMSNMLSLAVFLGLVYFRQLSWDFSAVVLVIIIVCLSMGGIASFRTTFPLWLSLVAFALYPCSLLLVYLLNYVLGWS